MSKLKKVRRWKTVDEFTVGEHLEAMKAENRDKRPKFETDEYKQAVAAALGIELTDEEDAGGAPGDGWRDDSRGVSVEALVKAMKEGNQG